MTSRKSRKWNLRWSVPVALALAIGSGYWGLVGGCAPAEDGGGAENLTVSESSCVPLDDQARGSEINLRAVSSEGRELTYTRRLILAEERGGGFQIETEVTADGELVMSIMASIGPTSAEVQIEYGPLVPGASSASAIIADGVLSGTVDGRNIVPMPVDEADPSAPSFEDGDPAPELGMATDLEAAVTDLLAAAATTAEACSAPAGNDVVKAMLRLVQKNSGHFSETGLFDEGDCALCWGKCGLAAGICIGGVAGGCIITVFGYPACVVLGLSLCAVGEGICLDDCYDAGEGCCPVACGEVTCCFEDEKCLSSDSGRCCGPGEKPCLGAFCCEGTEECMVDFLGDPDCCEPQNICGNLSSNVLSCCDPGITCCASICCNSGEDCAGGTTCCDVENICGDLCCSDDEVCHAGVCCPPENVCGSVCCDVLSAGCVDALSLCCGFDQDVCGNTCCAIGESCTSQGAGGIVLLTCCPDARICGSVGSVCCPEGNSCDSATNTCVACPNPTDTPCTVGGCCPEGQFCQDIEGICCDEGEFYCFGECKPTNQCF